MHVIADLHTHTLCASHAFHTALEMADAAQDLGYRALALTELWEDREHAMMAFIRHGELDEVTLSLAKLPAYLRHEDLAAFSAEADTVRRILWHIWESERFSLVNIL